jgi:hypothetical protein
MSNRYIIHEELDYETMGRWIMGYHGKRKLTERQMMSVFIRARIFCNAEGISTFSDLMRFFKDAKKKIRSKRGARSEWETKVISLDNIQRFRRVLL